MQQVIDINDERRIKRVLDYGDSPWERAGRTLIVTIKDRGGGSSLEQLVCCLKRTSRQLPTLCWRLVARRQRWTLAQTHRTHSCMTLTHTACSAYTVNEDIFVIFVRSENKKHMKIVYTMVWPVLIDIKWAPITKINLHKHLKHETFYNKISRFTVVCMLPTEAGLLYSMCIA